jgi:hypothetical protein
MDRSALTNSVTPARHSAIAAWWQAFTEAEELIDRLYNGEDRRFDIVAFMDTYLGAVSPLLGWEFGPAIAGKSHRLVLTAESQVDLRPLVEAILKAASPESRFEFYPYRLPEDMEQAERNMKGRTRRENIAAINYEITPGRHNTFYLRYFLSWESSDTKLSNAAFVLTETLLGEERLDKWVGAIDIEREAAHGLMVKFGPSRGKQGKPIAGLRADFEARIAAVEAAMSPYRDRVEGKNNQWCAFKREPIKAPDYARKDDVYFSRFVDEGLFQATTQDEVEFYSERFSKDETFLYLKMDGTVEDLDQELFEDCDAIADALGDVLKSNNLGCTIGRGTGYRYSYIDMAVTDLGVAIPLILKTLQAGKLSKRSWLLFQDADLQSEWVGIWPDSPPPPKAAA